VASCRLAARLQRQRVYHTRHLGSGYRQTRLVSRQNSSVAVIHGIDRHDRRVAFGINAALQGLVVLCTVLVFPETGYDRSPLPSMPPRGSTLTPDAKPEDVKEKSIGSAQVLELEEAQQPTNIPGRYFFLRPWRKQNLKEPIGILVIRPAL
jgi:hypothetical protein